MLVKFFRKYNKKKRFGWKEGRSRHNLWNVRDFNIKREKESEREREREREASQVKGRKAGA